MNELKKKVHERLRSRGVLSSIKAQLRADIFTILDDERGLVEAESEDSKCVVQGKVPFQRQEVCSAFLFVLDFLQHYQLEKALSVLILETKWDMRTADILSQEEFKSATETTIDEALKQHCGAVVQSTLVSRSSGQPLLLQVLHALSSRKTEECHLEDRTIDKATEQQGGNVPTLENQVVGRVKGANGATQPLKSGLSQQSTDHEVLQDSSRRDSISGKVAPGVKKPVSLVEGLLGKGLDEMNQTDTSGLLSEVGSAKEAGEERESQGPENSTFKAEMKQQLSQDPRVEATKEACSAAVKDLGYKDGEALSDSVVESESLLLGEATMDKESLNHEEHEIDSIDSLSFRMSEVVSIQSLTQSHSIAEEEDYLAEEFE